MSELLPCPFCGGENVETSYKDTFSGDFRRGVYCADCCGGIYPYYDTEAEAIAAWNTRAERVTDDEWESYQNSVPATEENMAKFGWVRERTCRIAEFGESNNPDAFVKPCKFTCGHWGTTFDRFCRHCGAKVVGDE